jgi:hypothetical protein
LKFMLIFNHDRGEKSVHRIENESTAQDSIAAEHKKGRKIIGLTYKVAATQEAEKIEPNYHHVENALAE